MKHRLLANLREQIPQCKIDTGNSVQHDAFAPVIERGEIHLVPHLLDVGHPLAFEEAGQMFLHDKRPYLTAGGDREADCAIARFNLDNERTENVDAERLTARAILGVTSHWRGDMVVDP